VVLASPKVRADSQQPLLMPVDLWLKVYFKLIYCKLIYLALIYPALKIHR
jgi:hypothetical protein